MPAFERDDALLTAAQRSEALRYLASVARPAWMPQPPLAALLPDPPRPASPRATLTSVAISEEGSRWASWSAKYHERLRELARSAREAGFDDTLLIDRREAILEDPIFERFGGRKLARRLTQGRPLCDAFKPVALWRALMRSREGDYVMWADASRYVHTASLRSDVKQAIRVLRGETVRGPPPAAWGLSRRWAATSWHRQKVTDRRIGGADLGVGSAYGVVHCPVFDCDAELALYNWRRAVISADSLLAYADLVGGADEAPLEPRGAAAAFAAQRIRDEKPGRYGQLRRAPARLWRFLNRTHVLASNMLLENTRRNRLLVWDWFAMAHARSAFFRGAKSSGFCMSHTEDQAAWTLLAHNRSLPLLNPCLYLSKVQGFEKCYTHTKRANNFLGILGAGRFEVVTGGEYEQVLDGGP